MGCIIGSLACCFGSAACSLCCAACPSCKNSTSTRIVYAFFLLLGTIVSCIMLSPKLTTTLEKIPGLCNGLNAAGVVDITNALADCSKFVGYLAVYRICFGFTCFFALMAVIMISVKTSKDPRSAVQNGYVLSKILKMVKRCIRNSTMLSYQYSTKG